jgi:predicted dinucleotide-binding enzyme
MKRNYTIGFIGTGRIGTGIAAAVVAAKHDIVLSNSHGPDALRDLAARLGPRASAGTVHDAAIAGQLVVVAVPLRAFKDVPVAPLTGKIVVVTTNYIPEYDGNIAELDSGSTTALDLLQKRLAQSRVVKAFSHLDAAEVPTDGLPKGAPNRRALAIAGNDAEAKRVVTELYDQLGYDAVDAGNADESWRFEFGQPAFVTRQTAAELRANLDRASRARPERAAKDTATAAAER